MNGQMNEVEDVIQATNSLTITDGIRTAIVGELAPIVANIAQYEAVATTCRVVTEQDAAQYAEVVNAISTDLAALKKCDTFQRIVDGLHKAHKRWVAARQLIETPLEVAKRTIRGHVLAWQEAQRKEAEERQRKLQAEADEKARRERERLEAQAAKLKTEAKREERLAEAQAVIAPTVTVCAPKVLGTRRRWIVKSVDAVALCAAIATNPTLCGYIEIQRSRLERAKAANPAMTVHGVVFEHVVC